jgi:predicted metal-dependent phosphoesterase TrpH
MPTGQPFTRICQQLAQLRAESPRADLHLHTCHSDGVWTPTEVVQRAAARGLGAIAITDHDTCSALPESRAAVRGLESAPEIIAGVEITCEFDGNELHLLGYFIDPDEAALDSALAGLREQRRLRFQHMVDLLSRAGLKLDDIEVQSRIESGCSLGRRDLAGMMVHAGHVPTVGQAFARYLRDGTPFAVPKRGVPVAEALALVRAAGGVGSWAHPPQDVELEQVIELRELGLGALEAVHPSYTSARSRRIRELAHAAGLRISGGSDCHGPTPVSRTLGSWGIRRDELESLRASARIRDAVSNGEREF